MVKGVGEQSCDFICLNEFAHGTILALNPLGFTVINLDGHEAITNNKLIETLEERIGKCARVTYQPFHRADVNSNQADVAQAKAHLDWQPQVNLEEGVTRLVV